MNDAYYAGECMRLGRGDRLCVPVPLYHALGYVLGTLTALSHGTTLVVPGAHADVGLMLAVVDAERCTALHGFPGTFRSALAQRDLDRHDLRALRTGVIGGGPCPADVLRQVVQRMHVREITVGYGQTEASALITQTRTDDPLEVRVATVGRALPHVELRIVDPATGAELPRGTQGELCCRGYPVMRGYYRMPDATARAIDADGWLHTGDLATVDDRGYCRITGRLQETIVRGGEPVYPRETEEVLHGHPKVHDVQVFGVPDPRLGEELAAWIRLRSGEQANAEELREFCRARIAHHKIPRYIRFVDAYPSTITGKVQKFKMRETMARELGLG